MARSNKYTSVNFNHIYDKKTTTSAAAAAAASRAPSSSFSTTNKSYSLSASSRLGHGGMLLLSRPSPKPVSLPSPTKPAPDPPRPESPEPTISLRPQGKTGPHSPTMQSFPGLDRGRDADNGKEFAPPPGGASAVVKSDKFVPPHLRPGYVPREKTVPPGGGGAGGAGGVGGGGYRHGSYRPGSGHGSSSNHYLDRNDRPKSGGGYDRRMRGGGGGCGGGGGELDLGEFYRPRFGGGDRPSSSG